MSIEIHLVLLKLGGSVRLPCLILPLNIEWTDPTKLLMPSAITHLIPIHLCKWHWQWWGQFISYPFVCDDTIEDHIVWDSQLAPRYHQNTKWPKHGGPNHQLCGWTISKRGRNTNTKSLTRWLLPPWLKNSTETLCLSICAGWWQIKTSRCKIQSCTKVQLCISVSTLYLLQFDWLTLKNGILHHLFIHNEVSTINSYCQRFTMQRSSPWFIMIEVIKVLKELFGMCQVLLLALNVLWHCWICTWVSMMQDHKGLLYKSKHTTGIIGSQ